MSFLRNCQCFVSCRSRNGLDPLLSSFSLAGGRFQRGLPIRSLLMSSLAAAEERFNALEDCGPFSKGFMDSVKWRNECGE